MEANEARQRGRPREGFLLASACRHVHVAPDAQRVAAAIAMMQQRHGVLTTQCEYTAACREMARSLDMCVSNGVQPASWREVFNTSIRLCGAV